MLTTVREKGDTVATFRYVAVHLMETLARWVPTTPELEAKALFGRHIWDFAQHADQLGYRTHELRLAQQFSREPAPDYLALLRDVDKIEQTVDRLVTFYDAVLGDLETRYADDLADADPLIDEPTIRVLERARTDFARMRRERDALLNERPDLRGNGSTPAQAFTTAARAIDSFIVFRPADDQDK